MADLTTVNNEKQFTSFSPVQICNIAKEQTGNQKIAARYLPIHGYKKNTPDYRSSYSVCAEYRDMNESFNNRDSYQHSYASNIDVESRLRYSVEEQQPKNKRNLLVYSDNYVNQFKSIRPECNFISG